MATTRPVALVTGATSGIGKETARALAAAGFEVIGTGRKTSGLTPPAGVTYLDLDVASDDSATAAVAEAIDRFGRIDVLVNNAGIGSAGAVEENSVAQAQSVFNINVLGVIRMTKAVLPHMRAQGGGRVINISSVLGLAPQPFMALYVASKHAIEGYSESLDHEVREHGVRVLLVQPAYTKTSFDTNAAQPDTPLPLYAERRRGFDAMIEQAMKDGDDPAVVAKAIVTAATDKKPKLRYTAGPLASRVATARRLVPAGTFDKQIRKNNRLPT
ncbi:oxidoreductase [Streptomyces sp. 2A115]|uniref:oxidoreductase n=1 Tax=Streptomyces sp. 2A115 TaxID=3457439 RepID=UPI003FCF7E8C